MPDEREYLAAVEDAEHAAGAGDFARADMRLREALRFQESTLGPAHPDLASTLNNLAVVCESLGHNDDAEGFYRRAHAIASAALPPTDPLAVTSRENLRDFCAAHGRPLEEWPGIDAPSARASAAPATAEVAADAARPAPPAPVAGAVRLPFARSWPTHVIAAAGVIAIIGIAVVAVPWRRSASGDAPAVSPAPPPATASPSAALPDPVPAVDATPAPPATATAPAVAAPAPQTRAPAKSSVPAVVAREPETPAPADAPLPGSVRVLVADVCASLSAGEPWRCEPLGVPAAPGRAAFYTRIASPQPIRVEHRWYQDTTLRRSVTLSVGANASAGYRTFSRQTLTPGAWRVELRAADGTLLHEAAFDVR